MIDKIYNEIMRPNIQLIVVIFLIFLLLTEKIETNTLLISIVLLLILIFHKDIFQLIETETNPKIKKTIIQTTNKKIKTTILFDKETDEIIKELKRFKKYNKTSYKKGYIYLKSFFYEIQVLEHNDIDHFRNTFENAQLYLKQSCNEFQSLSISVPEDTYLNSLQFKNKPINKPNNKSEQIGELCKQLHNHCSHLLYNLSLRLNEDFFKNPDSLKKEIIIDSDNVKESNQYTSYEMY